MCAQCDVSMLRMCMLVHAAFPLSYRPCELALYRHQLCALLWSCKAASLSAGGCQICLFTPLRLETFLPGCSASRSSSIHYVPAVPLITWAVIVCLRRHALLVMQMSCQCHWYPQPCLPNSFRICKPAITAVVHMSSTMRHALYANVCVPEHLVGHVH